MDINESLLRAILATVARSTFPVTEVRKIVAPIGDGQKQIAAYNLCDGKTSQSEIGKMAKLDPASVSRSIARWIEAGVVVRVGVEQYPLHVYALTKNDLKPSTIER
ncbi:MAG TPA: helix-turn-helix domain-containing protein [Roseiarcus sp.]|jgi:DNA-binding MarR family transcriptional regulator